MIPTMAVDVFLDRRKGLAWNHKYGPTDCVCALLLCAGAAGFAYVDRAPAADPGHTRSSRTGLAMLAVSVVCDALVPNLQKRLMCSHGGGPSEHSSISISSSSQGSSSPSGSPSPSDSGGSLDASELMVNVNGVGVAGLMAWMAGSGSLAAVNDALQVMPSFFLFNVLKTLLILIETALGFKKTRPSRLHTLSVARPNSTCVYAVCALTHFFCAAGTPRAR